MLTTNAEKIVATDAPIKPSQVFLGDNLIKGVLPKKKPKIQAAISLITISDAGKRNLHQNYHNQQKCTGSQKKKKKRGKRSTPFKLNEETRRNVKGSNENLLPIGLSQTATKKKKKEQLKVKPKFVGLSNCSPWDYLKTMLLIILHNHHQSSFIPSRVGIFEI